MNHKNQSRFLLLKQIEKGIAIKWKSEARNKEYEELVS